MLIAALLPFGPGGLVTWIGFVRISRDCGYVLAALGVVLNLASWLAFRKHHTTVNPRNPEQSASLVVTGLHRFSRNPMYLGQALLVTGWALWLRNPLALLTVPAFVLWMDHVQIPAEEDALLARFDVAYRNYRERVRRWL